MDLIAWAYARCLTEMLTTANRDRRRRLLPLVTALVREAGRVERGDE